MENTPVEVPLEAEILDAKPPKKKMKTGTLVIIIIAAVIVLCCCLVVVGAVIGFIPMINGEGFMEFSKVFPRLAV